MQKVKWGEFRLGDLFEVRKGKRLPERVLVETKGNIALINQSTQNNMIARYSGLQELNEIYKKNAITFGVNTKGLAYQTNDFYTIADVLFLKSVFLNEKNANYFITTIKKQLPSDGWDKIFGLSQMKDLFVQLPIKNDQIDFEFIESFIAELEAQRIAELEAYLLVTGLKDYTLTNEEQAALNKLRTVTWGKFKIEDVLVWQKNISELNPLHLDELSISSEQKYPFYGQATINNGIIEYRHLKDDLLNNKLGKSTILIHSNNQNTVYLDTPFYLKDGHGATSVLQSENLDKVTAQFLMSSIKKVILQKYSYNAKATKIELKNTVINLSVKSDNVPDYDYMRLVISAIQKLVIKDVVLYADKKIAATKKVVNL